MRMPNSWRGRALGEANLLARPKLLARPNSWRGQTRGEAKTAILAEVSTAVLSLLEQETNAENATHGDLLRLARKHLMEPLVPHEADEAVDGIPALPFTIL